jgi:hypothetical protein
MRVRLATIESVVKRGQAPRWARGDSPPDGAWGVPLARALRNGVHACAVIEVICRGPGGETHRYLPTARHGLFGRSATSFLRPYLFFR